MRRFQIQLILTGLAQFAPAGVLCSCLLLACADEAGQRTPGGVGSGGSGAGGTGTETVSCETRPEAAAAPLRVLVRGEYERTLRDVLGDQPIDAAVTLLSQLSDPKPAHAFRSMAVGTTGGDVEARFQVSDVVAQEVARAPAALAAVAPCVALNAASAACVDELLTKLGERLFRRPLDAAELTWLQGIYDEGEALQVGDGLRFSLFALLESPHFLYRLELRGTPLAGDPEVLTLSPYELAARLAFLVWGTTPDTALLESAAAGQLDSAAGLTGQLERLLADPRARAQLSRFYQEWLEIEQLPIVNQSQAFLAGIDGKGLAEVMQHELTETLLTITLDDRGTFKDLSTSGLSFVESEALATLYGIARPQPGGRAALDPQYRAGLLTRSALLLSGGEVTSPIRRGAFVRRKLLCDPIPSPDPNAFPAGAIQPPSFDADATGRQRWTQKTGEPQCAGCHDRFNALGFALESYDTIGRYRDTESIIDPATGQELKRLPIDAMVDVTLDTEPVRVNGAVELGQAFAESARAQNCLATQWLRFTAGRKEADADACVLADVAGAIARGASLLEALEQVVVAPEFRVRRLEAP